MQKKVTSFAMTLIGFTTSNHCQVVASNYTAVTNSIN